MNNVLKVITLVLLSTNAFAGASAEMEGGEVSKPITSFPEAASTQDPTNLWEALDTDKDGFISKTEATASEQISKNWDTLDSNKDEKLDIAEFSQIFSQKL